MKVYGRKWFVRWVAAFVSIVLFGTYLGSLSMNTLTVSAICCRKDGFDKSRYTLTGNVAQDVATIAKSQAGRTCSDFGSIMGRGVMNMLRTALKMPDVMIQSLHTVERLQILKKRCEKEVRL